MRTYAAVASMKEKYHAKVLREAAYPYVLVSYAYDKGRTWLARLGYPFQGMLDSGAYSVKSKGLEVNLDDYIIWAKAYNEEYPGIRVTNLDVIPAFTATKKERLKAGAQSVENAEIIREAGLMAIEVFHLADPIVTFEKMLDRRKPGEVVGVAGLGVRAEGVGEALGDGVFARIRDRYGWENVPPIHGFGISADTVCWRYPLASVDASTWVAPDRFGQVLEKGVIRRRERHSGHLRHSDVAVAEGKRILEDWKRREKTIHDYWANRGVRIEEELVVGA